MAITKHPSSQKRFAALAKRFLKLRKEHDAAVNRMWVGALAVSFTDEELSLIPDYLSANDHALLRQIREPNKRTASS